MANCNIQQLNITCGTDVVLYDRLIFDGETFDPNLSVGIAANLVSSLGKRTPLEVEVVDDELLITVPWIDGTLPGYYGLEVTGSCNSKKWSTYADSLIRYTKATVPGESEVTIESDTYDITQEVGYCYSNSPVTFAEVTVDDGYGTPSVDVTYEQRVLSMAFHNLKGNGLTDIEVDEQEGDEAVNTITIKTDADQEGTEFQVRNGSRGNGIASSSEQLSDQDGGTNTFTITDDDGTVHEFHSKNGTKGTTGDSAIFDPSTGNISAMKQTTGNDELSPMSQKAVTDNCANVQALGADRLTIEDDNQNAIVEFSNGHVKTMDFDSSSAMQRIARLETPVVSGEAVGNDLLSFEDGDGNVILEVRDGHLHTRDFDSADTAKKGALQKLKVLFIGNSFTGDSVLYMPYILKNAGVDIQVGFLYKSGASVDDIVSNYEGSGSTFYLIDTTTDISWRTISSVTNPHTAVVYDDWNIVSLQQSSTDSVDYTTFASVPQLIELILADIGHNVTFAWNINHSRATHDEPDAILANCQRVYDEQPIIFMLPYGTAIFDARQDSTLSAIGDGGDLWCSDRIHLQEGIPCYIASLANAQAIMSRFYPHLSVLGDTLRPTAAWLNGHVPSEQQNGESTGVTDVNCLLAQKMAILANKYIFEVKTIN